MDFLNQLKKFESASAISKTIEKNKQFLSVFVIKKEIKINVLPQILNQIVSLL
jgi:hypothetical protein